MNFSFVSRYVRKKRGIYYTIDALLAGTLLLGALLLFLNDYQRPGESEQKLLISEDLLNVLSELQVGEINSSFVAQEITNGNITDVNHTILRQAGEYWALNQSEKAMRLLNETFANLPEKSVGLRISIDDEQLFYHNASTERSRITASRMVSGITKGAPIEGYSSSAYLKKIRNKKTSSYAYFGGFIGQGNISFFMDDIPADVNASTIVTIYLEGDFGSNFTFFINGEQCNATSASALFVPGADLVTTWDIPHCNSSILPGRNDFNITFPGDIADSYVAGGFLRIDYRTDELQQNISLGQEQYRFPGVNGIANIYDSFYVAGELLTLDVALHINSSQQTYLTIGERIIELETSGADEWIILNDTTLKDVHLLDYAQLNTTTVPIRFAAYNATVETVVSGDADIVLITDLSGSMKKAVDSWGNGNAAPTCATFTSNPDTRRTRAAVCLDQEFVDVVMNYSGNRVWPVYLKNDVVTFYNNPSDAVAVKSNINSYYNDQGSGKTCLACAMNLAYNILQNFSNSSRKKFIVLMTDGVPTHCASGSCASTSTVPGTTSCIGLCDTSGACDEDDIPDQCTNCTDTPGPATNLLFSANRSVQDLNVTIYTIGFGPVDDCPLCNTTMSAVAQIGNGSYQHSSDVTQLQLIYQNISYDILTKVEQTNQSVTVTGNLTTSTIYDDSYINITYNPLIPAILPGKISTTTQILLDECTHDISIPSAITIIDAKAAVYSGTHWSDLLVLNNETLFSLAQYYVPYYRLGDPFLIQVPVNKLLEDNTLFVEIGDSAENRSNCSTYDSFIYTGLVPSVTARTDVKPLIEGCTWTVAFEDGDVEQMAVPSTYNGTKSCSYQPGNITYDSDDTYDVAAFTLFDQLDLTRTGKVFVNINKLDLEISTTTVSDIPYLWGPSLIKIEVWQ